LNDLAPRLFCDLSACANLLWLIQRKVGTMEAQKPSNAIEILENPFPSASSPATESPGGNDSTSPTSSFPEEKRPSFGRRIAEAFREGIASAKPDYIRRPQVKMPPEEKKKRQESADAGILDKAIEEGGSAAAAAGDKVTVGVDHVVQMVKRAPAAARKYARAFREGAASVKARERRERTDRQPRAQEQPRPASKGKELPDSVLHPKLSAREILRGAISVVKPSEVRGARRKIRMCKKRIHNLYTEIGCEAANAWGSGPVENEKVAGLLEEVRKNEEEIRKLLDHIAEIAAAGKARGARPEPVVEEVESSPAARFAPGPMEGTGALPPEEVCAGADQALFAEPGPEPEVEAEAAPPEEARASADEATSENPAAIEENNRERQ